MEHIYDILIIGGGPGGYTAALYGARAGLRTLVLEKLSAGGQMALTTQIDNYPGAPAGTDGYTLAETMRASAESFGAETRFTEVLSTDLTTQPKVIRTDSGIYYGKTVIIATGAYPKELGLPGEKDLTGLGVSYCAHCDGMFYRGKTVVVVGGGNTAVADALYLSRIAKQVILVHRRDSLRATKLYHQQLESAPNIKILYSSAVTSLLQAGILTGVLVKNLRTGEESTLSCDGLFVAIGRNPATSLFAGQLELDENGYIIAGESTTTNLDGVFAAGDVRTKHLRQIITAAADGAVAAQQAEEYLTAMQKPDFGL